MQKKFTIGLIALLGTSLFFLGCDDSSDDSNSELSSAGQLAAELGENATVDETDPMKVKLLDDVTIEADKTVTVPNGVTLDVDYKKLTVKGKISGEGTIVSTRNGPVSLENATEADNTANLVWVGARQVGHRQDKQADSGSTRDTDSSRPSSGRSKSGAQCGPNGGSG